MFLTMSCRIKPLEQFLNGNSLGEDVQAVLVVTCGPVMIATCFLPEAMMSVGCFVLQGLMYFLIGKGVSVFLRIVLREKEASKCGNQRT